MYLHKNDETISSFFQRDKTRCASIISLSRRSPHTNTSHSAAAHCSRKKMSGPGGLSAEVIRAKIPGPHQTIFNFTPL